MEIIRGRHTSFIDAFALSERAAGYDCVHIDIGTGDGRYVRHVAQATPRAFVIGLDAARENLHDASRRAPYNALFVIANAQHMPHELHGLAERITINFPWGSLLRGLLADAPALMAGLVMIAAPGASFEVRLNAGALAEAGWSFEAGAERAEEVLALNGLDVECARALSARDLKTLPTTWAKRLAFGRDPRAVYLRASVPGVRIALTA